MKRENPTYLLDDIEEETLHNFSYEWLDHTNFHVIQTLELIDQKFFDDWGLIIKCLYEVDTNLK